MEKVTVFLIVAEEQEEEERAEIGEREKEEESIFLFEVVVDDKIESFEGRMEEIFGSDEIESELGSGSPFSNSTFSSFIFFVERESFFFNFFFSFRFRR